MKLSLDSAHWLRYAYTALMVWQGISLLRNLSPAVVPPLHSVSPHDRSHPSRQAQPPEDAGEPHPIHAPSVSVVIPARNEAANIIPCLRSLILQQVGGELVEVIAVDDASTDSTGQQLDALGHASATLRVLHLNGKPGDWAGKPFALHAGAQQARGTWLLFTDADTRWEPGGVEALVRCAEERGIDLLTTLPRQVLPTQLERLVAPALVQTLFTVTPPTAVQSPRRKDAALANGQCILLRRSVYDAIGGYAHPQLRGALLDDTTLAQVVKRAGSRLQVAEGQRLLSVQMYPSAQAAWQGWLRSLGASFALSPKPLGVLALAVYTLYALTPYGMLADGLLRLVKAQRAGQRSEDEREGRQEEGRTGATRDAYIALGEGLLALAVWQGGYLAALRSLRLPLWRGALRPISLAVELALLGQACERRIRGVPIEWKGRAYTGATGAPGASSTASGETATPTTPHDTSLAERSAR